LTRVIDSTGINLFIFILFYYILKKYIWKSIQNQPDIEKYTMKKFNKNPTLNDGILKKKP